jgi:hypothetical protein
MATYNTAFGSLPGTKEMLGTTNTTGGGQQQAYNPQKQYQSFQQRQPAQTFAQLQKQGMARPAPGTMAKPAQTERYAPSQSTSDLRKKLQEQLAAFGSQPSRFDTQAFQQIRGAQSANLQAEYQDQQKSLNEDLARRGLLASSIAGGRFGDLAGQQARALATLDSELLQRAAETQAADRQAMLGELRSSLGLFSEQDLKGFDVNRLAGATDFENAMKVEEFNRKTYESDVATALDAAKAEQDYEKFVADLGLRAGEAVGEVGGKETLESKKVTIQSREVDARAAALISEAKLKGRELDLTEARNLAEQEIERERINIEREKVAADKTFRAQELKLDERQVELRATEIKENSRLRGLEIDNDKAYREAELELRTTQVQNEYARSGQQIDVDKARIQAQKDIAAADRAAESTRQEKQLTATERLANADRDIEKMRVAYQNASNLSQQSGYQYTVDASGMVVPLRDPQGNLVRTSEFTQNQEKLRQDEKLTLLDINLRKQLGLTEATGTLYNVDAVTGAATATSTKTLEALRQKLAEAELLSNLTGIQHSVNPATGEVVKGTAKTATTNAADLDRMLRTALGMSEATGFVYDPVTGAKTTQETVQGQTARNQMFLTLAQLLQNTDFAKALEGLGKRNETQPPVTTRVPSGTTQPPTTPSITGQTTTPPPTSTIAPFSNWTPKFDANNYLTKESVIGTPLESVFDTPKSGVAYKIGGYRVFHDGNGWRVFALTS